MNAAMPTKPYAGLIFDCDGTLTDSMPVHFVSWRRTLSRYGIEFTEARFYALAGMPSGKIVDLLAGEQGVTVDSQRVAEEKEAEFLTQLPTLGRIELVVQVAEHFRGRIPIAVASGGYRDVIDRQLQQIGCADWFDAIVTAEDTQRHKPFPDVFLLAAERLGVPPEQCLVYEDADLGLEAAQRAGADSFDIRTL